MDKIVSAVQFRDYVLLFTERGVVYKLVHDHEKETVAIRLETQINLGVV